MRLALSFLVSAITLSAQALPIRYEYEMVVDQVEGSAFGYDIGDVIRGWFIVDDELAPPDQHPEDPYLAFYGGAADTGVEFVSSDKPSPFDGSQGVVTVNDHVNVIDNIGHPNSEQIYVKDGDILTTKDDGSGNFMVLLYQHDIWFGADTDFVDGDSLVQEFELTAADNLQLWSLSGLNLHTLWYEDGAIVETSTEQAWGYMTYVSATRVPEPGTLGLFVLGIAALGFMRRRGRASP